MTTIDKLIHFNPAGGCLSEAANSVRGQTAQVMKDAKSTTEEALREYEKQEVQRWAAVAHVFAQLIDKLGAGPEIANALTTNFDSIRSGLNDLHRVLNRARRASDERNDVILRELNLLHVDLHSVQLKLGMHGTNGSGSNGTTTGAGGATNGAGDATNGATASM